MKPSNTTKFGLAVLAAGVIAAWLIPSREKDVPGPIDAPSSVAETPVPMASLPKEARTEPVAKPATPKPSNDVLTDAELKRFSTWMIDRGYPYTVAHASAEGTKEMTSYDTMTLEALQQLADGNDRHAALVLAQKILEKEGGLGLPPKDRLDVAIKYLEKASMLGYTSSLDALVEIKHKQAIGTGRERARGEKEDREALIDGYVYAYALEKRGSPTFQSAMQILTATAKLTPAEETIARGRARDYYGQMQAARDTNGLPPFSNELPSEIQETYKKVLSLYVTK